MIFGAEDAAQTYLMDIQTQNIELLFKNLQYSVSVFLNLDKWGNDHTVNAHTQYHVDLLPHYKRLSR